MRTYVRALDSVTQSAATDDVTVSSSLQQQLMTSSVVEAAGGAETVTAKSESSPLRVCAATWAGESTHALSTPSPHFRSSHGEAWTRSTLAASAAALAIG